MAIQEFVDHSLCTSNGLRASYTVDRRTALADHPDTSFKTLQGLSTNESLDLRYALAENHNIDARILDTLSQDVNPYVAHRAMKTLDRLREPLILSH